MIIIDWLDNQTKKNYEQSYYAINEGIKKTIPHYKSLLEKYPNNAEYQLYLGCTYGIKARIELANKEWFSVLYSGYRGISNIRKSRNIDDQLYDPYKYIDLNNVTQIDNIFKKISEFEKGWRSKSQGLCVK